MATMPSLPWPRINDFLAEVGAARSEAEFVQYVLRLVGGLVPLDIYGAFGALDPSGNFRAEKTVIPNDKWRNLFNAYYWRLAPEVRGGHPYVKSVDWQDYRHTEYVTDYLTPQDVRYSAAIESIGRVTGLMGRFVVNRSRRSPAFDERDLAILQVIQPHLANLLDIHALLTSAGPSLPDAGDLASAYPCLTRREAEITALLCRRYSTGMICSQLLISQLTVYKHIEHIFEKFGVTNRGELTVKILGKDGIA